MKAVLMTPKYTANNEVEGFTARDIVRIACNQESTYVPGAIESLQAEFDALRDIVASIMTEKQMLELAGKLDNWRIVDEPNKPELF